MNKNSSFLSLLLVLSAPALLLAQTKASDYKPANKIKVEGDGGWDYLASDAKTGLLYISHSNIVQVLDEKTGTIKATIPDTKGVHGIAIADDLGKGFISNGKDTSVTVFDLKTFATITKVKVTGKNPDAILYDPFSKKVFAYNGRSSNATVIDAKTNAVVATIPLEGKPEFSQTDGKGKVYVNIEDKSKVCMINSSTLKVEQTWSVAPGEEPSGLALDNKNHRLFMVCGNQLMMILDAENGKVIAKLPIGDGADGVAFDPSLERAYSSNGDGTVTVVQGEKGGNYKVLETITTQRGARTIAVDTETHHIFMPTAEFETPAAGDEKKRPTMKKGSFMILDIAPAK
ncbi:MAG TPA: YncE family protein [Bacteroidia bacterium]|jgi:YVTN family beta-propeller protein|nr:YncE family protein [Bacteroidia bacterium]